MHALGTAATETALVVSVVVYPSGAVTMTENVTVVPDAGAAYVVNEAECVADVYTYAPTAPPEADTAELLISVVFGVASKPVNVSAIELVLPVPHTAEGPEGADGP